MAQEKLTQRQQQSLDTRRAILEVSLELFVRRGFAGTTVRDIARAGQISPGLMFHYFPSKDALLQEHVAVMAREIDSVATALRGSSKPIETFREIAQTILVSMSEPYTRNLFLLANQVLSLESIPATAKKMVSRSKSIDASVVLIATGQRKGEIRKGDPHALAIAFWGAIQGIAEILVWNSGSEIPTAEQVISILRP
jgi:TetR/AcrR family transcriptional regulator